MHQLGKQSTSHNCQRFTLWPFTIAFQRIHMHTPQSPTEATDNAESITLIILIFLKAFHQQIDSWFPRPFIPDIGIVRSILKIAQSIISTSIHKNIFLFIVFYFHWGLNFHSQLLSADPFTNWLNHPVNCEIISKTYCSKCLSQSFATEINERVFLYP